MIRGSGTLIDTATFAPDLIVIASGVDANAFDPLSRMLVLALSDEICGGRVVSPHEGGSGEVVVPSCGLAMIEELSGLRTDVNHPFEEITDGQHPAADFRQFQRARLERQRADVFG